MYGLWNVEKTPFWAASPEIVQAVLINIKQGTRARAERTRVRASSAAAAGGAGPWAPLSGFGGPAAAGGNAGGPVVAGRSRGAPLALGPPPEPKPSPRESRTGDHEPTAQIQFKILRGHSDTVSSCHFCFEDTKILSCSYDRRVKLWVCYEHNNNKLKKVVTSSYDNTVKSWDMKQEKMLWTVEHEGIVSSCNISCDGKYVVSGSDKENTVYVFDLISATVVARIQGHEESTITRCCFDPDNQRVSSEAYDTTIKLLDMITRSTSITINEGHSSAVSDCCFTSYCHYLCTASWDKSLKIWDIKPGEFWCHEPTSLNQGHEGSISSCLFSQDVDLTILKDHWDWVTDIAISKNKKWIISASKGSTLRLWNMEKMDHTPLVIESRKARGSKIAQILPGEEWEEPFLCLQCSDSEMTSKCVFCHLSAPARKNLPLPPSVFPDL
ncbi:LOW QUALITY PROTEIN: WD repeat-containing protein 88 [Chlamydotis macqueenii]